MSAAASSGERSSTTRRRSAMRSGSTTSPLPNSSPGSTATDSAGELAALEQFDGVLHAHHAEIATTARDAVVHRVADQLLGLARQLGRDRRRDRQVVVLFCAQPSEAI